MSDQRLIAFVKESNRIEGITRAPTKGEVVAHRRFLDLAEITVEDLERFVADVAARPLRRAVGQDVRVGPHLPPPGGPNIESDLRLILDEANNGFSTPYETHVAYETLHPFLDGNGRSGRVLWAWQMLQAQRDPFALPFLHRWYYDSLDAGRSAHAYGVENRGCWALNKEKEPGGSPSVSALPTSEGKR